MKSFLLSIIFFALAFSLASGKAQQLIKFNTIESEIAVFIIFILFGGFFAYDSLFRSNEASS